MAAERYELLERIATGGMAEVFRARSVGEHGFQKTLAIKRILPSLASNDEFVGRFIAEAKLAVALTHTNIVQIFDFGRFAGSLYIAMEFVEGGDLAALLRASHTAKRALPISVALFIALELSRGLDYAHRRAAQAVVHRDVSPSNILLSYAGEVKIADFGIAQAIEHASGISDSRIMGKWRYMSPEQARAEPLDERSDIFSAGSVMFEMFTGRKLVPGGDPETIAQNLQQMVWPRASSIRPDLPAGLDDVLDRALRRSPAERYGRIEDLMKALMEISYSRAVRTSSLELAELVRELLPPETLETTTRERASLLDDIIRSEIGVPAGSVARRTEAGDAPEHRGNADDAARVVVPAAVGNLPEVSELTARLGPRDAGTPASFIAGKPDDRGITTWRLAGAADPRGASGLARSRRMALQIGVVVAAMVVAAATIATVRDRGSPPPPPAIVTALLRIQTEPAGADVLVDGRRTGRRTPVRDGLKLAPGQRRVTVELAGYRAGTEVLDLLAGETFNLAIPLVPEPRVLAVGSEPPGATAYVDDVQRGTTPVEILDLHPGRHEVVLKMRGYDDHRETVVLKETGRETVTGKLKGAPKFGRVDLSADAWTNVYVDGAKRPFCQTPCLGVLLPVGRRRLRFESPGLGKSEERFITVSSSGKVKVNDVRLLPGR